MTGRWAEWVRIAHDERGRRSFAAQAPFFMAVLGLVLAGLAFVLGAGTWVFILPLAALLRSLLLGAL